MYWDVAGTSDWRLLLVTVRCFWLRYAGSCALSVPWAGTCKTRKIPVETLDSVDQCTSVPVVMDKLKLDSLLTSATEPSHEDLNAVAAFWQGRKRCA